jgi:hypothetical protein
LTFGGIFVGAIKIGLVFGGVIGLSERNLPFRRLFDADLREIMVVLVGETFGFLLTINLLSLTRLEIFGLALF